MFTTCVMTKKERLNGELEKQLEIQSLLVEIRVLNRFSQYPMINKRIIEKQARLNHLWCDNKYIFDIHGNTKS